MKKQHKQSHCRRCHYHRTSVYDILDFVAYNFVYTFIQTKAKCFRLRGI